MSHQTLNQEILLRLVSEALVLIYGSCDRYESRAIRGAYMGISGEPVADLNYLMATGDTPQAVATFESFVAHCDDADLPFCSIVSPAVLATLVSVCERLGLIHATDWPLMVCPGDAAVYHPAEGVTIRAVAGAADHAASAEVVASAFGMPSEPVMRACPLRLYDGPAVDLYVAELDGRVLSTVTATHHGDVVGIWSMGTLGEAQGKGVGKALLSRVMADARDNGATAFFLGATPSGFPLYERLGYRTVFEAQVWVRGETGQA